MSSVSRIWDDLLSQPLAGDPLARIYRALGQKAIGIRASIIPSTRTLELMIEVPKDWSGSDALPEWRGMCFEKLPIQIQPRVDNHQLGLSLREEEQKGIFLAFCDDLVAHLEGISAPSDRVEKIEAAISRWGRFFEKCGPEGLSIFQQCGLFGELLWLIKLLESGVPSHVAIEAWRGCERDFHDFDLAGYVVEIKSTMTKEPRQITINNERQLDERGLTSLHLFVVTLRKAKGGGETLAEKVNQVRTLLRDHTTAALRFEDCLVNAGYLNHHEPLYKWHFIVREENLFHVRDDFPRLIDLPDGIGRLSYSVIVSSCRSFETGITSYLTSFSEDES